ncbi:hypothetical protein C8R43DRAFT_573322 [Mycena crocata]|nr:hypothetical protein C8R43DRAFT_573322 [Mycena crocata]
MTTTPSLCSSSIPPLPPFLPPHVTASGSQGACRPPISPVSPPDGLGDTLMTRFRPRHPSRHQWRRGRCNGGRDEMQSPSSTRDVPYDTMMGSLMSATVATRPNISFAVQSISNVTKNPGVREKIFRYLKGSPLAHLRRG